MVVDAIASASGEFAIGSCRPIFFQGLDKEFNDADDRLVVLEFYADWCDPCKAIGPRIEVSQ